MAQDTSMKSDTVPQLRDTKSLKDPAGSQAENADSKRTELTSSDKPHRKERPPSASGPRDERRFADSLGYLGIGLGLAALVAPRTISRIAGLGGEHRNWLRMIGAREIASGITILTQQRPVEGVWTRLGGDVIDLAMLGAAMASPLSKRRRLMAATAVVAGIAVCDFIGTQRVSRRSKATSAPGAPRVSQGVMISRSPEQLYNFWRELSNLPKFMKHLDSVFVTQSASALQEDTQNSLIGQRSHWVAKGPMGTKIEWDAEITQDRPNEIIGWKSLEGSDLNHMGSVRFERVPGRNETFVRVKLQYDPVGGIAGDTIAKLLGEDPDKQIKDDLRRFKQIMETGEVVTTEGQPNGRDRRDASRQEAAPPGKQVLAKTHKPGL